jgi:protein-tyrosine kinase
MSRVDEAMRRAAARKEEAPPAPLSEAVPVNAFETPSGLDTESFPSEGDPEPVSSSEPMLAAALGDAADFAREAPGAVASTRGIGRTPGADIDDGLLARIASPLSEKVIVDSTIPQVTREQYRSLAAVLLDAQTESGTRVVMIASAVPSEGKTLTACNLALTLSESYQKRVLLIDADLRRPTLHEMFKINAASGLSDSLLAPRETKLLVRQVSANLAVLPAGRPSSDPMASLTSGRMRRLLDEAREAFDFVILDTPPLVMLPDANLLAPMADGVVLVVRAGSTPHALVARAVEAIGRDRTLGVVLNRAESSDDGFGGYSYQYAAPNAKGRA